MLRANLLREEPYRIVSWQNRTELCDLTKSMDHGVSKLSAAQNLSRCSPGLGNNLGTKSPFVRRFSWLAGS